MDSNITACTTSTLVTLYGVRTHGGKLLPDVLGVPDESCKHSIHCPVYQGTTIVGAIAGGTTAGRKEREGEKNRYVSTPPPPPPPITIITTTQLTLPAEEQQ